MRLIDADALFEPNESTDKVLVFGRSGGKAIALAEKLMRERVNMAHTLTLDDLRPMGRWVDMRTSYNDVPNSRCSECGRRIFGLESAYNFCPNCGADMRGGGSDA